MRKQQMSIIVNNMANRKVPGYKLPLSVVNKKKWTIQQLWTAVKQACLVAERENCVGYAHEWRRFATEIKTW